MTVKLVLFNQQVIISKMFLVNYKDNICITFTIQLQPLKLRLQDCKCYFSSIYIKLNV